VSGWLIDKSALWKLPRSPDYPDQERLALPR
jgi:hypothetical protein